MYAVLVVTYSIVLQDWAASLNNYVMQEKGQSQGEKLTVAFGSDLMGHFKTLKANFIITLLNVDACQKL